ncbi:MAG: hypothetical protein IV107_18935 [Paucibacter sp.]|nr:hypothetical protein [Roseateles sp.]
MLFWMIPFGPSVGQTAGGLGSRAIKSYWIEGNAYIAIIPALPFDNPTGCSRSDLAIIPVSVQSQKQMLAALIHAMSSNAAISSWATGCYSAWGNTYPSIYALGVSKQ